MHLRYPARDGEAEPGSTLGTGLCVRSRLIYAVEALKDARLELGRNAVAGVADGNCIMGISRLERDLHPASIRGVLDGIVQQVPQHLSQQALVSGKRRFRKRQCFKLKILLRGKYSSGARRLGYDFIQVEAGLLQRRVPSVSPGEHEHVFDDSGEAPCFVLDYCEGLAVLALLAIMLLKHDGRSSSYGGKRRAQFMRGVCHEPSLLGE